MTDISYVDSMKVNHFIEYLLYDSHNLKKIIMNDFLGIFVNDKIHDLNRLI